MSALIPLRTDQHKTAGPYSGVIGVARGADIFVISGQAPVNEDGAVEWQTLEAQARITLKNCKRQLAAAGCEFRDVFKATIYLTDLSDWDAFNAVYCEFFEPPYPARTAVEVGLLPGFRVEIEMWAAKT